MVAKRNILVFLICIALHFSTKAQVQLIINEVSQGYSGGEEYVELLVVGTPTCNGIPTYDLRQYYIDDNNGTFATGTGTGIASGCIRFTSDPLWSNVPAGTLILIYNDAVGNLNPDINPANDDFSTTDGNCKLQIPISNCTYFGKNTAQPSTSTAAYPTTMTTCGVWTAISMANSDDSFHTLDASGNMIHAVSWGNNINNTIIYFAVNQTGMLCQMTNSTDNNPANQANWTTVSVTGNQTPGSPNNAANAAWINSMNNSCTALLPFSAPVSVTNAGCTCTGSATVTATGAIGPYTYSWSPGGSASSTVSNLCAGNYTVSVTSSNGCVSTSSVAISGGGSLTASVSSTNVACNGGSTASASVSVSGGSGSYTYTWSPTGGTGASASGLSAGTYTVNFSDGACTGSKTVSIIQPAALTATANVVANENCNGGSIGSATAAASGGTAGYTYAWSPSGGSSGTASGLPAGNYTVTVSDANSCAVTRTVSITQPSPVTSTVTASQATCGSSNGSATVTAGGGTGAYTYSWSPSGGTSNTASGLGAGSYTVKITDANGCIHAANTTISNAGGPGLSVSSTSITCNGGSTGSATATPTGSGPFTYTWSPTGGNSSSASGLNAGVYNVTIKDVNGCVASTTVSIAQPSFLDAGISTSNVSCNGASTGASTVTASGGTPAYSYSWSPTGGSGSAATGLGAGNYTVIVTDANGCAVTKTLTVTQPPSISLTVSNAQATCGNANGSATVTAGGGTGAYTYTWSPSGGNNATATGLGAGNYTISVGDANGCVKTASTVIANTAGPSASVTSTSVTCNGGATGSATVSLSGGTGPYSYTWSPAGGNSATATNLPAGSYTITITDNNGCTGTSPVTISQPAAPLTATATTTDANCGTANGSATVNISGGTPAYSYSWSTGATGSSTSGLSAGSYSVNITDQNGCTKAASVIINNNGAPAVSVSPIASVSCNGGSNGSATVSVSGGVSPYTYTWSPSGGNGPSASGLAAGNYNVSVKDNNGCISTATVNIAQPASLNYSVAATFANCSIPGSATISVSGGTPSYSYTWSPSGGNSATASGLVAGNYTVTISDNNNCQSTATVAVNAVNNLTVAATVNSAAVCAGQPITLTGSGATSYSWTAGNGSLSSTTGSSVTATTTVATTYTVTGASGSCTGTNTVAVTVNNLPNVGGNASQSAVCRGSNVTLSGNGAQTYTWTGGVANGIPFTPFATQTYTVIGTDANGCMNSAVVTVTVNPLPVISANSSTVCIGNNATFSAGGASTYTWSNSSVASSVTVAPTSSAAYTVTGTDLNGCKNSAIANVTVNPLPAVSINPSSQSICAGSSATLTAIGANTYTWSTTQTVNPISVSPASATIYSVMGTDINGCVNTATVIVSLLAPPVPQSIAGHAVICKGKSTILSVLHGNYTYHWSGPSGQIGTDTSVSVTQAGAYTLTATNACGSVSTTFTVAIDGPSASFNANPLSAPVPAVVSFTNTSMGNQLNWSWNFANGNTSAAQNPNQTFTNAGSYNVTLLVTDNMGCRDSASKIIMVTDVPVSISIPNIFSPNGDGVNDEFFITATGIIELNCKIYDRWGLLLYEWTGVNGWWDGKNMSNGLRVSDGTYYYIVEYRDDWELASTKAGYLQLVR